MLCWRNFVIKKEKIVFAHRINLQYDIERFLKLLQKLRKTWMFQIFRAVL